MGPRKARQQPIERACRRTQERGRHPDRRRDAHTVSVASDIFDRDPALVARDADTDSTAGRFQLRQPRNGDGGTARGPGTHFVGGQVPQAAQQVVDLVERRGGPVLDERLQRQLEVAEGIGVEQLPELLLAEQLTQQVAVQGEGAGPPLGQWRVAVVHVGRHVVEQQAARERARLRRLDTVHGDLTARDATEDLAQRVEVEHVGQALAVRLDQDREAAITAGDGQQVCRALALLPERRPGTGPAPRQEERPGRVLPEAAREERGVGDLPDHEVLDILRGGEQQLLDPVEAGLTFRHPDRDPVVGPDGLDLHPEPFLETGLDGQGPRRMDSPTERRQERQPPVAQLVAEPLHHHSLVRGEGARGLSLVLQVGDKVLGSPFVEVVMLPQSLGGIAPALGATPKVGLHLADERPERPAQFDRPAHGVALPERQLAGDAGSRADGDPVMTDLEDAPAARPEHDDVTVHPGAKLVDHLLVELAHAAAGRAGLAFHEHAKEAAIGDRAAARDGDDARVAAALDRVGDAVPHHARLEFRELVRWVGAREHAKDTVEDIARERLVGRRSRDGAEQVLTRPAVHHGHRHELLSEDIERIPRDLRGLDRALVHPSGDHRDLEQVAAVLREDDALAGRADLVTSPTDPLEATGHARRALDLDDEIDGAHVDAELEARARGDEGREAAGLQLLLDLEPLFTSDAAVVGTHELLPGELVEALGQTLAEAPAVREHDRALVAADQLEDPRVDRRPDARAQVRTDRRPAGLLLLRQDIADGAHVVDRYDDLQVERLPGACIDDRDLAIRPDATEEAGDRVQRPLGGRQADALWRLCALGTERLKPFQAQGKVGTPFRAGHRVDLVDDDVFDATEDLARLAGQEQVQALRGRDEDVGRASGDLAAVFGRGVAGAAGDGDAWRCFAESLRREADPRERGPQVALHVVRQSLERRDVENPDVAGLAFLDRRARMLGETVERVQEGGQCLAAPRGCVDERVLASRDGCPSLRLGLGGRLETRLEPGANGRRERRERIGDEGRGHGLESIGLRARFDRPFYLCHQQRAGPATPDR